MDTHLVPVQAENGFEWLSAHWDQFLPGFERTSVIVNREFLPEDLLDMAREQVLLPVGVEQDGELTGCFLLEKVHYRRFSRLCIFALSGKDVWSWFDDAFRASVRFSEHLGFDGRVECHARPGLARRLKRMGHVEQTTLMVFDNGR